MNKVFFDTNILLDFLLDRNLLMTTSLKLLNILFLYLLNYVCPQLLSLTQTIYLVDQKELNLQIKKRKKY